MIVRAFAGRGRKLTVHHQDANGDGLESLDDMVAACSAAVGRPVSREAYLLASVSASEHAKAGDKEKALIQRVMMNRVGASFGDDLEQVVTKGKGLGRGEVVNEEGKKVNRRPCTTANGPWEQDLFLAESNLAGELEDVSGGARFFVHKTGFASVTDYQRVVDKWYGEWGIVPVDVGGVSSLRIFMKESKAKELGYA
jgi:hypothetical protein